MIPEKKLLSFLFGCMILAGCSARRESKNHTQSQSKKTDFAFFKAFHGQEDSVIECAGNFGCRALSSPSQKEARLVDVPIPLQSILHDTESSEEVLVFTTPLNSEELVTFYRREMERLGWVEQASFLQVNQLLIFRKPDRWLAVSQHSAESKFWQRENVIKVIIQQTAASST